MLEELLSTYEHWYFVSVKKYSYTSKSQKIMYVMKLKLIMNWHQIVKNLNLTP